MICKEIDGWIDLVMIAEGKKLEVNSGTVTFEQIFNFIIKCGYTELEIEITTDCIIQSARSYKLFKFIESARITDFPYLEIKLKDVGRADYENYTSRYEKGIWSFLTGIYPGVPLNIVKHIHVGSPSLLPFAKSYIRKTAVNSAIIIEVNNEYEMDTIYSSIDYPNIIHFKMGDEFYLNYPTRQKVSFQNVDKDYGSIKYTILNREMVELSDGLSISRTVNYFEKEGGSSLNRIMILSENLFLHHLQDRKKLFDYEIDSIELRPISLMSLIIFDSGYFADLCRFEQYAIEEVGNTQHKFHIRDGNRSRIIDLALKKII